MSKCKTADALIESFPEFSFHHRFLKELTVLLEGTLQGKEKQFFEAFNAQASNIKQYGPLVNQTDGNERLKGFNGEYYSIHLHRSQFNIRLLVHITWNEGVAFLCAFSEKSGKKQTEYGSYTRIMEDRFSEIKGG